jgi:parallel beta-helix repeat protein
MKITNHLSLITIHFLLAANAAFAQGSLTPPGPPALTMKSLDQVRSTGLAINATNTPGDSNYHFIIGAAGSYYLTGNLDVTKPNGIHVTATDARIDLNGFRIARSSGSGGYGIKIEPNAGERCRIENGSITGLTYGIYSSAAGGAVRNVTVTSCTSIGFVLSHTTIVESCIAKDNGSTGMLLGGGGTTDGGSVVRDCVFDHNGSSGLQAGGGCVVENCTAYSNTTTGFVSNGQSASISFNTCNAYLNGADGFDASSCTLTGCVAAGNTGTGISALNCALRGCYASGNSGVGIQISGNAESCSAFGNTGSGFSNGFKSASLKNCSADSNTGNGIEFSQAGSVIEGCNATNNGSGTSGSGVVTGPGNLVDHCAATNNKANGITLGSGSSAVACTTQNNGGDGVSASTSCYIARNNVDSNAGAGVHITTTGAGTGTDNRIEGNKLTGNTGNGILVDATLNLVIGNTARANTAGNYQIVTGNRVGLIVIPTTSGVVSGNTGGTDFSTSSWSNIAY